MKSIKQDFKDYLNSSNAFARLSSKELTSSGLLYGPFLAVRFVSLRRLSHTSPDPFAETYTGENESEIFETDEEIPAPIDLPPKRREATAAVEAKSASNPPKGGCSERSHLTIEIMNNSEKKLVRIR
jgi:hypothetical protein